MYVLVVFVPVEDAEKIRGVLDEAGAGRLGDYRGASFSSTGTGRFHPLEGANPTIGTVGEPEAVPEERIEVVLTGDAGTPAGARRVVEAMLAAHPYEEPAYHLYRGLTLDEL